MQLTFAPIVSWPLAVLIAAALAWLVLGVYGRRLQGQPTKLRVSLTTLRMAMWFVLMFAMVRPSLLWSEPDERARVIYVAADASRSMTVNDGLDAKSRREVLLDLIARNSSLLAGDERVRVELFDFADSLTPVDKLTDAAEGDWTDLAAVIEDITERSRGERALAAVLLSDGANRTPTSTGGKAVVAAQRFAEQTGVSVHAVPIGSSDLSAGGVDLAIESISVDPLAFVKKTVPLQAQVRVSGFTGQSAKVRVLVEDRNGLEDGQPGELKPRSLSASATPIVEVKVTDGNTIVPVDLSFVADEPGDIKIRVEIESADGETQLANNSREALVTVQKNGLKVAYFDTARWEKRFLGRINSSARVQLDYVFVPDTRSLKRVLDARDWFGPNEYDVFLIGDVPPELFAADSEFAKGLLKRVRGGAGLGLIAGAKLLGDRPPPFLQDVLPVTWRGRDPRVKEDGFALVPTPVGLGSFVLRGVTDQWKQLPAFDRVFDVSPRNAAIPVLAETPDGEPLLIAAETGRGRTAVLATADTWMWAMAGYSDTHQRFWQQLLLWLGRKELDTDKPVWVSIEPRTVDQGRPVEIKYGARTADGEPREDVKYRLSVTKPDGETVELPASSGLTPLSELADTSQNGDYWIKVEATTPEGETNSATTRLLVNLRDAELDSPAADPAQLEQIAAASGGVTVSPDRFDSWLSDLLQASRESDIVKMSSIALWDRWPLLAVFLALLSIEWTIRRLNGLV